MYLITYAEVAPGRVDRGADAIEHVLDRAVISRLEKLLGARLPTTGILASPHPLHRDADENAPDGRDESTAETPS
jgi:Mn-dependent DtxR family transcriptional regulator